MSSAELQPQQLDVRYHDLNKIDCNPALVSVPSVNPSPMNIAQKATLPSTDELQLHQIKLPLKLPQRRKFIMLAEANSANFGLKFHHGLENFSSLGSSVCRKALDLPMAKGQEEASEQLPAKSEETFYETEEVMKTKKKLLAQLAKSPGAIVDSQPEFRQNESRFHRSSNPSRTCRFCGREFPSGRSLGGHMRVHGDLLFADTSPYIMAEQEDRNRGESETVGSLDQMDPGLSGRRMVEEMKPNSFTSSSNSSQMNLEEPTPAIKLDRHGQEDVKEEEELDEGGEKVTRMVNLSSFECTSLVNKPGELLGCVDASSDQLITGKSKVVPTSALYELRRNPKPNQRFFGDQECRRLSYAIWQHSSAAPGAVDPRSGSRSPTTEHERACSECGKVFSSWKALFGHMRCHPEREWRGIQPPERSNELDRTNRSILPKANSDVAISSAQNIINCVEPTVSAFSNVESKEKIPAKLQQDVSSKSNVLNGSTAAGVTTGETISSPTQKSGACMDMESRQCRDNAATKIEQAEDRIAQAPAFMESKKSRTKRTADDLANGGTKDLTKAWSPSWYSTGKRSKRNRSRHLHHELSLTSEATSIELGLSQHDLQLADEQQDLDMANCLVLLSSAGDIKQEMGRMRHNRTKDLALPHQSKKRRVSLKSICLERLSRAGMGAIQAGVEVRDHGNHRTAGGDDYDEVEKKIATFSVDDHEKAENHESFNSTEVKYQCSTCKKCFNSHQALGGHRASHKKMKGCFAQTKNLAKEARESSEENVTEDDLGMEHMGWQSMALQGEGHINEAEGFVAVYGDSILKGSSRKSKIKGHECSICHRIFASGQALGGHKRCHWNGDQRYVTDTASVASSNIKQSSIDERPEWFKKKGTGIRRLANEETIDLNLPAPFDEDDEADFDNLPAQGIEVKEEEAVNSLMDCSVPPERQNSTQENWKDWITKDLLGGHSASSSLHETRSGTEDKFGCNRRLPMWNQKWDNAAVDTPIPQVCSFEDPLNVSEKTALTTW